MSTGASRRQSGMGRSESVAVSGALSGGEEKESQCRYERFPRHTQVSLGP